MRYDEAIEKLEERVTTLETADKPAADTTDLTALADRIAVLEQRVPALPTSEPVASEPAKAEPKPEKAAS